MSPRANSAAAIMAGQRDENVRAAVGKAAGSGAGCLPRCMACNSATATAMGPSRRKDRSCLEVPTKSLPTWYRLYPLC
jgi:hypothetical protein